MNGAIYSVIRQRIDLPERYYRQIFIELSKLITLKGCSKVIKQSLRMCHLDAHVEYSRSMLYLKNSSNPVKEQFERHLDENLDDNVEG